MKLHVLSDGISTFAHDLTREALHGLVFTTQIAQTRTPFRLEGASVPEGGSTAWWRAAIDSAWTPWIAGGAAALVVMVTASVVAVKLVAGLKRRQHSWTRIAAAMGLDRGERECLARLSGASCIVEPAALLMSPSVFGAAMQAGGAALTARDRATLLALAARHEWLIPAARPALTRSAKNQAILEAKLVNNTFGVNGARATSQVLAPTKTTSKAAPKMSSKPSLAGSVGRRPGPVTSDRRLSA